MTQVNLSLKDIYQELCPDCQKKLRDLIKDKLVDKAIEEQLEEKKPDG